MDLSTLIPHEQEDWRTCRPDESYDRTTIFRYMDGAAELYLAFGFERLLVRRLTREGTPEVTVELYDMGDPGEAFGIFSRNRSSGEAGIGQGSEIVSSYLLFWRDRYFATIYPDSATAESRRVVRAIGREIAERIGRDGDLPGLLQCLPPVGLIPESIRYFHLHTDLNAHYFLADTNLLGLGVDTDAVLGSYLLAETSTGAAAGSEPRPILLVIRYPDAVRSSAALEACLSHFGSTAAEGTPVRGPEGTWVAVTRSASYLIAVFDAPDGSDARKLIEQTRSRISP